MIRKSNSDAQANSAVSSAIQYTQIVHNVFVHRSHCKQLRRCCVVILRTVRSWMNDQQHNMTRTLTEVDVDVCKQNANFQHHLLKHSVRFRKCLNCVTAHEHHMDSYISRQWWVNPKSICSDEQNCDLTAACTVTLSEKVKNVARTNWIGDAPAAAAAATANVQTWHFISTRDRV